jgi:hypothetical protein
MALLQGMMEKLIERYKTEVFDYKAGGSANCMQ